MASAEMATGATPRMPVKRNVASLVGGFVIAFGVFALWMMIAAEQTAGHPGVLLIVLGALAAAAVGVWIRVADL